MDGSEVSTVVTMNIMRLNSLNFVKAALVVDVMAWFMYLVHFNLFQI